MDIIINVSDPSGVPSTAYIYVYISNQIPCNYRGLSARWRVQDDGDKFNGSHGV